MVRIRSEHAIGFLKGRFHSLKRLRVNISNERSHKFATYWIAACVALHAFAMQCEAEERGEGDSEYEDPFILEGLSSGSDSESNAPVPPARQNASQRRVHAAKAKREKLKRALFRHKRRRQAERDAEAMEDDEDF